MNFLITGISGFFGQNITRRLLSEGHTVLGIDDNSIGNPEWLPESNNLFVLPPFNLAEILSNRMQLINYMQKWKKTYPELSSGDLTIIHLASRKIPRYGGRHKTLVQNTDMMKNMVYFARVFGCRNFIFFSTSDIYGMQNEFMEQSSSMIGPPEYGRWAYAISKMWCEQYLYGTEGLHFTICRIFGSYGPYQALNWTAGPQSVFISQALKKETMTIHGDGTQTRCFSFVDDIVDGLMRIIARRPGREIFNLGNPSEEISINRLAESIWRYINPGIPIRWAFADHSNEVYQEVIRRQPNIEKARCYLGYNPKINLGEGLKKTIDWQRTVV